MHSIHANPLALSRHVHDGRRHYVLGIRHSAGGAHRWFGPQINDLIEPIRVHLNGGREIGQFMSAMVELCLFYKTIYNLPKFKAGYGGMPRDANGDRRAIEGLVPYFIDRLQEQIRNLNSTSLHYLSILVTSYLLTKLQHIEPPKVALLFSSIYSNTDNIFSLSKNPLLSQLQFHRINLKLQTLVHQMLNQFNPLLIDHL
jgi:hypothetical protein